MKNSTIKIVLIIVLTSANQTAFSQQRTDGNFLFKVWFFIEHINQHFRTENDFPVKDSSLFSLFESDISFGIDTLQSKGFSKEYVFLSLSVLKNNEKTNDSPIIFSKQKHLAYIGIPVDNCDGYTLCVNTVKGSSYRLQGFYGNDLLSLLLEIKEEYQKANHKTLSTKSILENYSVAGINLNCIYDGLCSKERDIKKYPCLKTCSDFIITIH